MNLLKQKTKRILIVCALFFISMTSTHAEIGDINIHGYISQGYLISDHNNFYANTEDGTFQFNEMGLNFSTAVSDDLHISLQFFARDLGRFGNDEIKIGYAYADYHRSDAFGLRAGIMKLRLGLYTEIRDMDILSPNIFYPNGVYDESWRDIFSSIKGVGLYGNLGIGVLGKFKYQFQFGFIDMPINTGTSNLLEDRVPHYVANVTAEIQNVHVDYFHTGSLYIESPFSVRGLRMGVTGYVTSFENEMEFSTVVPKAVMASDTLFTDAKSYCASVEYSKGKFTWAYEYMVMFVDLELENMSALIPIPEFSTLAYYGSMTYRFTEFFEMYLCYSMHIDDRNDRDGSELEGKDHAYRRWLEEIIISFRYDFNESWILKLETHINDGAGVLLNKDQDDPDIVYTNGQPRELYPYKKHWMFWAVKLSYSF